MAIIYPKLGTEAQTARDLLTLAQDPQEVRTNTDNGFAFVVGEELYARWLEFKSAPEEDPVSEDQIRRRPGRPRKQLPETEND